MLIAIIVLLTGITYFNQDKTSASYPAPSLAISSEVQIWIEGAVAKPGAYVLKKGSHLEDVLACAQPLAEADLTQLKLKKTLYDGQKIQIPTKLFMTVILEGAIEQPGPLKVPQGIFLKDLDQYAKFLPEADLKKIKKKKRLKDGEIVQIPAKKSTLAKGRKKKQQASLGIDETNFTENSSTTKINLNSIIQKSEG